MSLNPCFNGICSLRHYTNLVRIIKNVLILVLMEYALWDVITGIKDFTLSVLILVLMEYALWEKCKVTCSLNTIGLNPCFNGICSLRRRKVALKDKTECLNPCFTGICSLRLELCKGKKLRVKVLILVLMEYALWVHGMTNGGSGKSSS